jgi:hypothetical protein
VWVVALSSNWQVRGNDVTAVKDTLIHHMQEGIRVSDAASYNTIVGNRVHDLPTDGRGLTTDVDASYNTFQGNTATNLWIGLSDEKSGKGNRWIGNSISGARKHAFGLMSPDWNAARPSLDTSTQDVVVSCNTVTNSARPQFVAGSSIGGRFENNSFTSTFVAPNLVSYWGSAGNTWNSQAKAPPAISLRPCSPAASPRRRGGGSTTDPPPRRVPGRRRPAVASRRTEQPDDLRSHDTSGRTCGEKSRGRGSRSRAPGGDTVHSRGVAVLIRLPQEPGH